MREYIDKSVKVLLLISNGFLQSYHCKLEETFAMSLSNESGKNCIIPVLLEDVFGMIKISDPGENIHPLP
jgi:hypothetical protein